MAPIIVTFGKVSRAVGLGASSASLALFLLAGCSKTPDAAEGKSLAKTAREAQTDPVGASANMASAPQSVFSTNRGGKDPFFPNSTYGKEKPEAQGGAGSKTNAPPVDIASILQAGFQGVSGNNLGRMALVYNIILEQNKDAVIPFSANGVDRTVSVRCVSITRTSVVLRVQGQPQPVTLVLSRK